MRLSGTLRMNRGVFAAASVGLGLSLTLASGGVMHESPLPGSASVVEMRGWPAWYVVSLRQPIDEPGVKIRFEEQWLPSLLEGQWPIGSSSVLGFLVDWVVLTVISGVVLATAYAAISRRPRSFPNAER